MKYLVYLSIICSLGFAGCQAPRQVCVRADNGQYLHDGLCSQDGAARFGYRWPPHDHLQGMDYRLFLEPQAPRLPLFCTTTNEGYGGPLTTCQ
jgi:hypothetical protein